MIEQGILIVSFGTSCVFAEEKSIRAVEEEITAAYADAAIYRAYTSRMVRNILRNRNTPVNSVEEALLQMRKDGIRKVFIQPTHLLYGEEYEKIIKEAQKYRELFFELEIGRPLLSNTEDMIHIAEILRKAYPYQPESAVVLMGHGTSHYCNTVYAAMEYVLHEKGYTDFLIGTVEAYPDFSIVIKKAQAMGIKNIVLVPFMLVAGDHAANDMAGEDENSWKSRFLQNGFKVQAVHKGLGEYKAIRKIYCEHIAV